MTITQDSRVADILAVRPDLRWTLVANGIEGLADETHFPPPHRTVGEAAARHGVNTAKLVAALAAAWEQKPDSAFVAEMKQKYADFKGGCCHGPVDNHG